MEGQATPKDIAFVLYPGLTPLDLVGPLEVFTILGLLIQDYRPVVVGETLEPVETDGPLKLVADKTFAEVPHPFALIVPGGGAPTMRALGNEPLLAYLKTAAEKAQVIGSVCTGSLILAAAGLLEGRKATTHWSASKQLERLGARYVPERWVDDGSVITAAGVSAGIDMALHLIGKLAGDEVARQTQLIIEYDPQPPLGRIHWNAVDRNMLDPLVEQWIAEGLADRPDIRHRLAPAAS
jgi:transcriptional regulator GlxA family with amidase domain